MPDRGPGEDGAVPTLVVRGGRITGHGPSAGRVADVVVAGDRIVEWAGPLPAGVEVLDATGAYVSAGWIDSHTHVFGDIGVADPDTAGVLAGVTAVIDAGSSGSMTVDELFDIAEGCLTDVHAIVYLDRRGIADTGTIPTSRAEIPAVPIGELAQAIERHGERIVAVKTGIYADLGRAWTEVALASAALLERPAYFHIGNFPTHQGSDVGLMRHFFDALRPGDVVTHCYTPQAGGVLDEHGRLLAEVTAATGRGVVFDLGHSGGGFDVEVARRALDAGLRPTTVSSDVSLVNVRRRVRNLAHVMSKVWALGFDLDEVVAMVTEAPARHFGLGGGTLAAGAPADLAVFEASDGPVTFTDTSGNEFEGPGELRVRATVKAGRVIAADHDAVLSPRNLRFRLLEPPGAPSADDHDAAEVLDALAAALPLLPVDGEVVQAVLAHHAGRRSLGAHAAARAVRRAFADRNTGNQAGWLVAEECARAGQQAVADRLAAAAAALRAGANGTPAPAAQPTPSANGGRAVAEPTEIGSAAR